MHALELLAMAGRVPPADDTIIEEATDAVLSAAGQRVPMPIVTPSRRRAWPVAGAAVLVVSAAAVLVVALVVPLGHRSPASHAPRTISQGHGTAAPSLLTAQMVSLISARTSAAVADSGTAVETIATTGGLPQPLSTIDVTFSGPNVNYLITSNGDGAEGVQNRVVAGQLYLYIKGPDLKMHWYHQIEAGAAAPQAFPDPRTLMAAITPTAGLENVGRATVAGTVLTHLRATTPGSIGKLGIPDLVGTVTALDVWVDSDNVVRQMIVAASSGQAARCWVAPGAPPAGGTAGPPVTVTVNGALVHGAKLPSGVSCATAAMGSSLDVTFSNLGTAETVTVPAGAIDQVGHG